MSAQVEDRVIAPAEGSGGAPDPDVTSGVHPVEVINATPGLEIVQVTIPAKLVKTPSRKSDFFGSLSEIQAELEDLGTLLANIRTGKAIIPTYAEYIETTRSNLGELVVFINSAKLPPQVDGHLHTLRHINNAWEHMQVSPLIADPHAEYGLQQQLHYLDLLTEQIHKFHYQISLLTVPHEILQRLEKAGPGFYIPFHEVFGEEVPRSEDRDALLKHIALAPHLTPGGFVDVESGRIYKYSTSRGRRMLSVAMLVGCLALATGIVAAACFLPGLGLSLTKADLPKMMVAWGAVLVGMGVHVVVGSAKRSKTQNGMPSVLMDLILIIDARFGEIAMKLILALIGLFGLVIVSAARVSQLAGGADVPTLFQVTPLNAFLVGYSLDSIIELFGTSMEGASQVKGMIKIP